MEAIYPSASLNYCQFDGSTFDELSMEQSLLFSDSLKDLKNLKAQLYSAAEYFELSYITDDHKQFVVNTLKDYAIKALINTVDHLGSVSYKVNGVLNEKVDTISAAEFRVSSIEQKIRTTQELVDREGLTQQSLLIKTPRYHKRYVLPGGQTMPESGKYAMPKYEIHNAAKKNIEPPKFESVHNADKKIESAKLQSVQKPTLDKAPSLRKTQTMSKSPSVRARSVSPRKLRSPSPSQHFGKYFSPDKRAPSPVPVSNPLARSGSLAIRPKTLNSSFSMQQYPSQTKKSISMKLHAERNDQKDTEQNPSRGKKLLKTLLSRRKSKKDDTIYNYLEEY
ncbi:protein ABIL2-like isoform X1 [Zingiber officinale]|uniref:Uncharacterized protein n=1 Tax=Zingiber officinale TaxID=94328 RepID=A0A8J5M5I9_ZINOF|nr:protein ABIL2-like isoform X1 [Zingiber officinale]XP_042403986.1 protein ABIL2-like isoform X1 [Zingiber officinale]KAG6533218.1 hypothetical protein ZIOFF_007084 [Zingiber officinale]